MSTLAPPRSVRAGAVADAVRRRPVIAFLVLVFGLGWSLLLLPTLVDRVRPGTELPLPLLVLAATWGVLVPAALLVTGLTDGRPGVRALLGRVVAWRFGPGWWLLALAGVPLITLGLGVLLGGRLDPTVGGTRLAADLGNLASALLLIHVAEELAWTGFLQARLADRCGTLWGAVLTAVPFAALHLPLALRGPVTATSIATDLAGLLLLGLLLRVAIGLLRTPTAGSVLAAAVLHTSFNAANNTGGPLDHLLDGIDHGLVATLALALLATGLLIRTTRTKHERTSPC